MQIHILPYFIFITLNIFNSHVLLLLLFNENIFGLF